MTPRLTYFLITLILTDLEKYYISNMLTLSNLY